MFVRIQLVQSQKPVKAEAIDKEVVIESGPVEYEKTDESNPMGEEDEFDELEEEDEEPVSAVHLMGHLYEESKFLSRFKLIDVIGNIHRVPPVRKWSEEIILPGRHKRSPEEFARRDRSQGLHEQFTRSVLRNKSQGPVPKIQNWFKFVVLSSRRNQSLRLDFEPKMASSHDCRTCSLGLLQGLATGTSPLVCANLQVQWGKVR